MLNVEGQVSMFDQDIWCGKTSPALSQVTEETISELSWKSWQGSSKKESLFLDLRKASGQPRESSSSIEGQLHGGSSMPSIGACHNADEGFVSLLISTDTPLRKSCLARVNTTEAPSEEIVSRLSDILEKNPDPKYNLSAKACQGILNRANRRGKTLPPMLQEALEQVIARERERGSFGIDLYNTQITGDVEATLGINCGVSHGRNGVLAFEPGIASREGGHIYEGVSGTLRAKAGDNQMSVAYTMQDREGKAGGGKGALIAEEKSATLRANNWQYVFQPSSWDGGQTSPTLTARNASGCQRMPDKDNFNAVIQPIAIDMGGGKSSVDIHTDRSPTLTTTHYGEPAVVYDTRGNGDGTVAPTMTGDHQNRVTDYTGVIVSLDRASFNQGKNAKYDFEVSEEGINSPIVAKGPSAVAYAVDCRNCTEDDINGSLQSNSAHSLNGNNVVRVKYIVRRLTPLECERLQGFPDGHTDIGEYIDTKGKKCKTSDASRYKALGNSIALPSWKFILKRLCSHYERDATMASLFDGIGGFPILWEQINGKGSCLWASEIEEFPIAVTKERISK